MAAVPPASTTSAIDERLLANIEALTGPNWVDPLRDATGASLGIRVLAGAVAPYFDTVPRFNWAGSGRFREAEFPHMTTFSPQARLDRLEEVRLFVTPVGRSYPAEQPIINVRREYPGIDRPVLVIGLRYDGDFRTAEVFVHIEEAHVEAEEPSRRKRLLLRGASLLNVELHDPAEVPEPAIVDRMRVDVGNPYVLTLYREPVPGRNRPYPEIAPVTVNGGSIGAADRMGELLAGHLARHYGLTPVP